jgi:hypothetical protein
MEQALTLAIDQDLDSLELFNQNDGARNAAQHERRVRELTCGSDLNQFANLS